jgi:luciferase family oxidoreductase group 1
MKWSVLDQSPTSAGSSEASAIRHSLHSGAGLRSAGLRAVLALGASQPRERRGTAPEVLAAAIAATTRRIRVGSAGVMLPHYSALKVAEQFRVLEAIAPGRIDLGVGRAPGSDGLTARALNPHSNVDDFPRQVQELQLWVSGLPLPESHPYRAITAHPKGETRPQLWILGSSGLRRAARGVSRAALRVRLFLQRRRRRRRGARAVPQLFRPSSVLARPQATICVWALAADTAGEAARLATAREHWRVGFEKGLRAPLISPEDAAAYAYTPAERATIERLRADALVGTAPQVAERLRALARACSSRRSSSTPGLSIPRRGGAPMRCSRRLSASTARRREGARVRAPGACASSISTMRNSFSSCSTNRRSCASSATRV